MGISIPYQGSKLNVRDRMRAEALACDNEAMLVWYNRLVEIALNGIKWHGLPPEIDPRYLEMALLFCGSAIFFYDEDAERFAVWRFMPYGRWDHYRDPIRRRAIPEEGWSYNRILTPRDSVCIYNNLTRTPDVLALRYYVRKLWAIDRALDVNIAAQKTPNMIICDERQRLTFENLIAQYQGNIPFIFGNKTLAEGGEIKVLNTEAPFIAPDLMQLKKLQFAEAQTYWGVEANPSEKKERMIAGEVLSNLGAVEIARQCRLNAREQACDQINELFGPMLPGPVWVEFNAPQTAAATEEVLINE